MYSQFNHSYCQIIADNVTVQVCGCPVDSSISKMKYFKLFLLVISLPKRIVAKSNRKFSEINFIFPKIKFKPENCNTRNVCVSNFVSIWQELH